MADWTVLVDMSDGREPFIKLTPSDSRQIGRHCQVEEVGSVSVVVNGHAYVRTPDETLGLHSAAAVLPAIHARMGSSCFAKLDGQWAIAMIDRVRHKIIGARDAGGTRPLFFRACGNVFLLGSSARSLAFHPAVPNCNVDAGSMVDWIVANKCHPWATMFLGVVQVPPGGCIEIVNRRVCISSWWLPSSWSTRGISSSVVGGGGQEGFAAALEASVRDALRSAQRPSIALSSGLDSSSIAAVAGRLSRQNEIPRPMAISARFPEYPESDESSRIERIVSCLGFPVHWVEPSAQESGAAFFGIADHPQELMLVPMVTAIARMATQVGSDSVAFGTLGDIIGGQPSRWFCLLNEMYSDPGAVDGGECRGRARFRSALSAISGVHAPWHLGLDRNLWRRGSPSNIKNPHMKAIASGRGEPVGPLGARPEESLALRSVADREATSVSRLLGAFGIAASFPLLDRRVVEASLELPHSTRRRHGLNRWAERELCRSILPQELWLSRQKVLANRFYRDWRRQFVRSNWPASLEELGAYFDLAELERRQGAWLRDRAALHAMSRIVAASCWLNATGLHGN